MATAAVDDWNERVRRLRAGPGDSFDFTGFSAVLAVVCTPYVVYTAIGVATAEVTANLRACSALPELAAWLRAQ
jgi:hypothetical protein